MASEKLLRASGGALILAGLTIGGFVLLLWPIGGFFGSTHAQHPLWVPAHLLHLLGALLTLFGLLGLFADQAPRLGRLGLLGFGMAFAGTALFVGTGVLTAFIWPVLAAHAPHTLEPDGALFVQPAATLFLLTGLTLIPGYLLLGFALLRAGTGPRTGALLLMIGIVLAIAPPEPVGPLPWFSLVLGGVAFGAGLAWWGGYLWGRAGANAAPSDHRATDERVRLSPSAGQGGTADG
jgi:hypothetical protein